jgi:hypothetical protein
LFQKIVSLGCGSGKARLHIALLSELFVLLNALRSLCHSLQCVWNQLVPVPHTRSLWPCLVALRRLRFKRSCAAAASTFRAFDDIQDRTQRSACPQDSVNKHSALDDSRFINVGNL